VPPRRKAVSPSRFFLTKPAKTCQFSFLVAGGRRQLGVWVTPVRGGEFGHAWGSSKGPRGRWTWGGECSGASEGEVETAGQPVGLLGRSDGALRSPPCLGGPCSALTACLGVEIESRRVGDGIGEPSGRKRRSLGWGVRALCALTERPRWWAEEVKTGGKGPRNERRQEVILSASRVNWWVGRLAADRKAPRA
jgi:hypothetical protein